MFHRRNIFMKQNKLSVFAALAFLATTVLAGCGNESVSKPSDSTPGSDLPISTPSTPEDSTSSSTTTGKPQKEVESLEITQMPTKTVYNIGETFDPAGMVVTAHFKDGTTGIIANYEYDATYKFKAGDTSFTITFRGVTASIPVTVEKRMDLTIDELKKYRYEAEDFDTSEAILRSDFAAAGRGFVENGANASGGKNLCGYVPGSKFTINFKLTEAATIYITSSMSDTELDYNYNTEGLQVSMDDTVLELQNNVVFTFENKGDFWNWKDVDYGTVELPAGEHTLTIDALATRKARPNIDFFDLDVVKFGDQVKEKKLEDVEITALPTKLEYEEGDNFDPTGIVLTAKYDDHSTSVLDETDYTFDKTALTVADDKVTVTINSVNGKALETPITKVIDITVGKAYLLKLNKLGENIFEAENLPQTDKWIHRQDNPNADYVVNEASASGGKSIQWYAIGTQFELEFFAAENVKLHLSHTVSLYENFHFDDVISVKIDDVAIASNNPELGHRYDNDWYNWTQAWNDIVTLDKGEHKLTIDFIGTNAPNYDCFNFFVMEYGDQKVERKLESLTIAENPTKLDYNNGEVFNPAGLKLNAVYSDTSTEVITEGFEVVSGELYNDGTGRSLVTITYGGKEVVIHVNVNGDIEIHENKTVRIQGENFDKTNYEHNGNGFIENNGTYAEGGAFLGNGSTGYVAWNVNFSEATKITIRVRGAKYEDHLASDHIAVSVDSTNISLVDPEMRLGAAADNQWFNFKTVEFVTYVVQPGQHEIKLNSSCNIDWIEFVYEQGDVVAPGDQVKK